MPIASRLTSIPQRRSFTREGGAQRRDALIEATLESIAQAGMAGTTVRGIAERAGVTPGLIRHYFSTKDDLVIAAYNRLMETMTATSAAALAGTGTSAADRLNAFVKAAVSAPVADPRSVALWASFIQLAARDETMRAVHARTYLNFRNHLQILIAEALSADNKICDAATLRRHAVACNAVIDGLWLEGSALPQAFAPGELTFIATTSISRILGLALAGPETDPDAATERKP